MKFKLLTLALLLGTCAAAFGQETSNDGNSSESDKGLTKVSIMYPFAEDKTFDMDYYETKHMPMVAGFIGDNLVMYTIEKGLASGIPNQPLPFLAIGTFYVKDLAKYQEATGAKIDIIREDIPNYTNVLPIILVSEVVK